MKKLMIALAAAATTMFSFGAETETAGNRDTLVNGATGTSFEALAEGSKTVGDIVDKDDEGATVGAYYWYSTAPVTDELGAITNDVASGVSRPDLFANQNQANTKSLQIDTTAPLVRTALPNAGASKVSPVDIGDGIYLDTLVKFTAAEEGFTTNSLTAGDKIAIEYVEHGADALNEAEPDTYTNFVIRAGLIGAELGQTNYYAYVSGDPDFTNFDKDAWHRLTVRTIANVGDGHVGFVIYLDGDVNKTLEYPTTVDAGFNTASLDPAAKVFYNSEKHALFPSAVDAEDIGGSTISSVAFSGNGFIDDVSFAAEAPQFIKAGEAVVVPFVADAGVTAISVLPDGATDAILVDMTAENLAVSLPALTTAFTVTATVNTAEGYEFVSIKVGETTYNTNPAPVTGYAGDAITITTARNNFSLFDANREPITGTYQTLTEALAVEGVAKIQLAHNYEVTEAEITAAEESIYTIDGDVVIDLYGMTLDGGEGNGFELFYVTGSLKVIDSVGGGKIVYGGDVFGSEGSLLIGDVSGDNGVTIDGVLLNADAPGYIIRAKVLAEVNTDGEGAFLWNSYLGDGENIESDANLVGDYWVVTPDGGSEPTQIQVPTAATTLVYDGTEQTGVAAGTGYTLSGTAAATDAGEYTATATPASGYAWVGGSTDATNITWSIAKATVTATVSLTVTEATYDSTKTTVTDYTTPSVNFGLGAPELVESTDYTVAWSATEVTGAGTFTYTVSPVAGSNYTFTETSATLTITAGGDYPTYIEDLVDGEAKTAYEKKYDDWKATYGADTESAFGAAFLLNIDPAAADQTLEPVSITMEGGKVVISANQTLTAVNGKVYVKVATTLAGLATAEWTEATLDEGKVQVTPGSSDTAGFYKIKVDF